MEKIKPIALSFKNNEEDRKLYEWISSKSNFSGFIKDILRERMEQEDTAPASKESKIMELDLSDF